MCSTRVLALLALLVGMTHSFSWDIILGADQQLLFFYNGTLTHSEPIPAYYIHAITYDPVHDRVLFADVMNSVMSISSYDLSTKKINLLVAKKATGGYTSVAYDPVTQLLFWKDGNFIYSFSLNPAASSHKAVVLKPMVNSYHYHIAVDSCGGYIYWVTANEVGRARFDGSGREVLRNSEVYQRLSLAIDQQTQKIYWTETIQVNGEYQLYIESANFDGRDRKTLDIVRNETYGGFSLAVSKDFIYWQGDNPKGIWQLPKNPSHHGEAKLFLKFYSGGYTCQRIAANYTIAEQTREMKSCEALKSLNLKSASREVSLFCVDDTLCYSGERSDVSMCQNYCFQGDCSVSAEGQPICSCKAGYSGERCEVNTCQQYCLNKGVCSLNEEDEAVCQCTADYDGDRCEISAYKDNNCTVAEGDTKFRCNAGNSVEKKANPCNQYCLNNGICSLNKESEPVCQCTEDYEGERCEVPAIVIKCYAYKNVQPVTLSKAVKSTCASTIEL